ncbi:MAG TPA: dUTP diphosphatase [Vicinamibacterales bacterium]|nr:dUTP diphosphatase [Vicinamibacterales bacterium]
MRVRITRLNPSVPLPVYSSPGAAGFDLAAAEDVDVPPGEIRLVGTGLVVKVPAGSFFALIARSSTPLKRGLVVPNGVGVIDSDYCGPTDEVKIQVMNVTKELVSVKRGDRLAQGIVLAAPRVEFEEAGISEPSRGGFGSTGA